MPITAITIENFKGIRDPISIKLRPITLLFGPNSSGKSTIVQALHYALEVFDRNNLDPGATSIGGKSVDLGGFETLVNNHDLSKPIRLRIDFNLENEDLPHYVDGFEFEGLDRFSYKQIWEIPMRAMEASVEVLVRWNPLLQRPMLRQYRVDINGERLARIETTEDGKQVFLTQLNPFNPVFLENITASEARAIAARLANSNEGQESLLEAREFEKLGPILSAVLLSFSMEEGIAGLSEPIGIEAQGSALPRWGKPLAFHEHAWKEEVDVIDRGNFTLCLSSLLVGSGELIRDALRRLLYIGPIREIPSRSYLPEKSPDLSRWASGAKGWDVLYDAEPGFIEEVNQWLTRQDRLNTGYRIEIKRFKEIDIEDPLMLMLSEGTGLEEMEIVQARMQELPVKTRVSIREEATGIELMPPDVGVGISQVLPVIVAALHIKEGILAIEQPELHIHPALQVTMGDLFISQIERKAVTFLLETHSEHLMLRMLRRIRETEEGTLPPGKSPLLPDQVAVYFVEQSQTGIGVTPIRVSQEGEFIDRWPRGFFGERMEELF
ncbi:MAG: hypothetical protein CVU64_01010 [Deltaproteobacteria bacterium HGW-Deltaproteobacteria-21]|nr:MAG: hypothetical protein CVU64_01010 [Deltaproteobacteria bacterium HGW-Deltaproteobacteria-21]